MSTTIKQQFLRVLLSLMDEHGMNYEEISTGMEQFGQKYSADRLKNAKAGRSFSVNSLQLASLRAFNEYVKNYTPVQPRSMAEELEEVKTELAELRKMVVDELIASKPVDKEEKNQMLAKNNKDH